MQDMVYYSPQHEGFGLSEDGKLQSLTNSASMRRTNSKQSLTSLSTMTSMTSDTSSCARISPPNSFHNGLRRSTIDLSDFNMNAMCEKQHLQGSNASLRYRGRSSTAPPSSSPSIAQQQGGATRALLELAAEDISVSSSESFASIRGEDPTPASIVQKKEQDHHSMGLEFLEDLFLGYISVLFLFVNMERRVRNLFRGAKHLAERAWTSLTFGFHFEEPLEKRPTFAEKENTSLYKERASFPTNSDMSQHSMQLQQDSPEELLSPLKLVATPAPSVDATGGWGHFADFQEELADETSFIPSCSRTPPAIRSSLKKSSTSGLAPLAEVREDEEGDDDEEEQDEDWSF